MSDVNNLSSFFKVFKLLGLLLFKVNVHRTRVLYLTLYTFYILLNITLSLVSFIYFDDLISSQLPSGILSEYAQILSPIIAHTIIIVETMCKCKRYDEKILRKIVKLETLSAKLGNTDENNRNFLSTSIWMFIAINFMGFVPDIVALTDIRSSPKWYHSHGIRIFAHIIARNFLVLYLFTLYFIKFKIMFLTECLTGMRDGVIHIANVRHMHKLYNKLWKLLFVVNQRFGWSLSAIIMYYFVCSLIGIYWVVFRMRYGLLGHDTFDSFLIATPPVMAFIWLYYSSQSLKDALTKMRRDIHQLIRSNLTIEFRLSQKHGERIVRAVTKLSLLVLTMSFDFNPTGQSTLNFESFHTAITGITSTILLMLSITDFEFELVKIT